jgi:hypothetical protein
MPSLLDAFTRERSLAELYAPTENGSEVQPVTAGWGACRSCGCKGYTKGKGDDMCGTCGHHWKQHY